MSGSPDGFEALLRQALAPVDPPDDLEHRLELTFGTLVDAAADEIESWELSSIRYPRKWLRLVGAVVVGSGAAAGLALVRTRQTRHRRRAQSRHLVELAARTAADLRREARRVRSDVARRRWPRPALPESVRRR